MSIYRDQHASLKDLLAMANNQEGATLLIPDLQRPYIWKPTAVVVLVDSLVRGWPFGTLLTWRVSPDDPARALARAFWRVVDKTDDSDGEAISKKNPPATFHMVLDGQQRIQSLLLAFGGDAWGFKMFDRDWDADLQGAKPRGRRARPSWSLGCLCVDLRALSEEHLAAKRVVAIDFTKVLRWAVTDTASGQSKAAKVSHTGLPRASDPENSGRFVRLSRLWTAAPDQDGVEQEEADSLARILLEEEGTPQGSRDSWERPVGALLLALGRVKRTRVTYLELSEYSQVQGTRENYNDSVVNIFTRLNTAGRTLTREDISFAWLKVGWNVDATEGSSAAKCFDSLREQLDDLGIAMSTEDLVAAVTFMWAVEFNGGKLLTNNDLLKGEAIRPMAEQISANWSLVVESATRASALLRERRLQYGDHYQSQTAITILWAWMLCGRRWRNTQGFGELEHDAFDKMTNEALASFADRWLICSQWAGRWASGSSDVVAGYASRLAACAARLSAVSGATLGATHLRQHMEAEVRGLESDAIVNGLSSMRAGDRKQVRTYYTALWIWNRLNATRWSEAKLVLREGRGRQSKIEVDHVVACELWNAKLQAHAQSADSQGVDATLAEDLEESVNEIGNCLLLEKNFNISKSKKPLADFLKSVHEFKAGSRTVSNWATALQLEESHVASGEHSPLTLQQAFARRTSAIREELEDFVRGTRVRVDLSDEA